MEMFRISSFFILALRYLLTCTTASHLQRSISVHNYPKIQQPYFSIGIGIKGHYHHDIIINRIITIRGGENEIEEKENDEIKIDHEESVPKKRHHPSKQKKKKKKDKSSSSTITTTTTNKSATKTIKKKRSTQEVKKKQESREKLDETMKRHKDTASMLGAAIRDHAEDLLQTTPLTPTTSSTTKKSPFTTTFQSLGLALGATDTTIHDDNSNNKKFHPITPQHVHDGEGGGVEASTSAVLANYFLHTHGGSHGIQSLLSLSSVISSLGAWISPTIYCIPTSTSSSSTTTTTSIDTLSSTPMMMMIVQPNPRKLLWIRRTLVFAGLKHMSGICSAILVSAKQIPEIGLSKTRQLIEEIIKDPVAQYFFYCTLILFWTGIPPNDMNNNNNSNKNKLSTTMTSAMNDNSKYTTTTTTLDMSLYEHIPWWLQSSLQGTTITKKIQGNTMIHNIATLCIVGPIFIREFVSILWVFSDILVILSSNQPMAFQIWKFCTSIVDAIMSILFTSTVWRHSNLISRQKLLAEFVSRISLLLEVIMGILIGVDAIKSFWIVSLAPTSTRCNFWYLVQRLVCTKLYIHFLLIRKDHIHELITLIRGGAIIYLPDKVLDTLLDPKKAMGLLDLKKKDGIYNHNNKEEAKDESTDHTFQSFMKWIGILLGI